MSYEESLKSISLNADASIGIYTGVPGLPGSAKPNGAKQYHFVKVTGPHQVGLAVAAGPEVMGVLQNKPQQVGMAATIGYSGVTNVVAGGVVSAGDGVVPNGDGAGVKGTADVVGYALADAAAGELFPVLLG